ncbi:MAG: hypothetical protein ABI990_00745 [Actinomycetota bacterium]
MDPAGTAGGLAAGLGALGIDVEVVLWFGFPHRRLNGRVLGRVERVAFSALAPWRFDVFHYQSFTLLPRMLDARWARRARRTLLVTFHGDDCRRHALARTLFPSWGDRGDTGDPTVEARISGLGRVCEGAVVANLELATYVLPFFRRVYIVPPALEDFAAPVVEPRQTGARPVVLHAPSVRELKGTSTIAAAAEALSRRIPLEFRLLERGAHTEVLAEIGRADVVVDQVDAPSIGVVALEAMRAGKPVLSELDEHALAPYQRDLPAVHATAATLERELEALLRDPDRRHRLAKEGERYVERHAPEAVARATLDVYRHVRVRAEGRLFTPEASGIRPLKREEEEIWARLRQA